jgi:hypothetical protein
MLLLALSASPAAAQTAAIPEGGDQDTIPVIGSSPQLCLLGEPSTSTQSTPINVRTIVGRVVTIQEMTDPDTLSTRAASIELQFDAFCNYPHKITLESDNNGMFRQNAGGETAIGFANAVPYRAELRWDQELLQLDADALNRKEVRQSSTADQPTSAPLLLRLQVMAGATNITTQAPLLAGEYRDVIRITVGPQ